MAAGLHHHGMWLNQKIKWFLKKKHALIIQVKITIKIVNKKNLNFLLLDIDGLKHNQVYYWKVIWNKDINKLATKKKKIYLFQ